MFNKKLRIFASYSPLTLLFLETCWKQKWEHHVWKKYDPSSCLLHSSKTPLVAPLNLLCQRRVRDFVKLLLNSSFGSEEFERCRWSGWDHRHHGNRRSEPPPTTNKDQQISDRASWTVGWTRRPVASRRWWWWRRRRVRRRRRWWREAASCRSRRRPHDRRTRRQKQELFGIFCSIGIVNENIMDGSIP